MPEINSSLSLASQNPFSLIWMRLNGIACRFIIVDTVGFRIPSHDATVSSWRSGWLQTKVAGLQLPPSRLQIKNRPKIKRPDGCFLPLARRGLGTSALSAGRRLIMDQASLDPSPSPTWWAENSPGEARRSDNNHAEWQLTWMTSPAASCSGDDTTPSSDVVPFCSVTCATATTSIHASPKQLRSHLIKASTSRKGGFFGPRLRPLSLTKC